MQTYDHELRKNVLPDLTEVFATAKFFGRLSELGQLLIGLDVYDCDGKKCGTLTDVLLSPGSGYEPEYIEISGPWSGFTFSRALALFPFEKMMVCDDSSARIAEEKSVLFRSMGYDAERVYEQCDFEFFSLKGYLTEDPPDTSEQEDLRELNPYFLL